MHKKEFEFKNPEWETLLLPYHAPVSLENIYVGKTVHTVANIAARNLIDSTIRTFAEQVLMPLSESLPTTYVPVLNGGLDFYKEVQDNLPYHPDCHRMPVQARTRGYLCDGVQPHIVDEMIIPDDVKDRVVITIDDLDSTGRTRVALEQRLLEFRPIAVISVVLVNKNLPKVAGRRPDYALFSCHRDCRVVGRGLDLEMGARTLKWLGDANVDQRYSKHGDVYYR